MRIFKTRMVAKFAKSEHISDSSLAKSIDDAEDGLVEAELGGGLIKQRIARKGQGKSGGFRMVIAYRIGDLAVFLYGFAKNQRDNIDPDELETLRDTAADWFAATDDQIAAALESGILQKVTHDDEG